MTRILVADDDPSNRLTLSVLLECEGFEVEVAASFEEAAERLGAPEPGYALVLLDQHLGDGNGSDLLPVLRARLPDARAVLISGSAGDEERAMDAFDASAPKGTSFPELLALLRRTLAGPRAA